LDDFFLQGLHLRLVLRQLRVGVHQPTLVFLHARLMLRLVHRSLGRLQLARSVLAARLRRAYGQLRLMSTFARGMGGGLRSLIVCLGLCRGDGGIGCDGHNGYDGWRGRGIRGRRRRIEQGCLPVGLRLRRVLLGRLLNLLLKLLLCWLLRLQLRQLRIVFSRSGLLPHGRCLGIALLDCPYGTHGRGSNQHWNHHRFHTPTP